MAKGTITEREYSKQDIPNLDVYLQMREEPLIDRDGC